MRAFQQLIAFFFALFALAYAQKSDEASYDATVYVTSTVYRVNTVTLPGTPTGYVQNSTSTIHSTYAASATPVYSVGNHSTFTPTATKGPSNPSGFPGAASALNANAFLALAAAGVAFMAL